MKRRNLFCRVLSAVLILFGGTFSWAAGACDISQYDCIDLSTYDNSHPIVGSIKKSTPRLSTNGERGVDDAEIPNSGIIPSNIHGDYLGYISYGGTGTNGVTFSKDFAAHEENGYGRWYGENGKKQFINFNDNDPKNLSDNTKSIRERLGGHGYYVFGDLVTAGGPIINPMSGDTFGESLGGSWNGGYINDGGVGTFNGSVDQIRLPKGVTKDDIVFARVYWFGHLYKYDKSGMGDSLREICSAEEKRAAGSLTCKRFSPTLNIPDIKNYQNVKLKIGDTSYEIEREICEGELAYNSAKGTTRGMNQKYNMKYVCSTDITDKVREKFKDFDESIDIGVGDIKATKEAATSSNIVWTRGAASADKNIDSGYDASSETNPRLLPFGGWYVVLVYDKTLRSQAELKGLDFPDNVPDSVKYSKARSAGISGDKKAVNKYIDSAFKPKNITLFDGYMPLEPTASRPDLTAEAQREITGFFTPKSKKPQGKLIFASFGANKGNVKGADIMSTDGIFVAKTMAEVNNNRLPNNKYNPADRSFFNGSRSWLEIDDDGKYELEGKSGYHQGFDLDEFDISDKLGNGQSQLAMAIKSSPYRDSSNQWVSNRAFVPFFGVSIDIYIPKLCYEQKMYDTQGWLGFYNLDGTPITGHAQVEDVQVVTGENLYYRTEIRNQEIDKDGNVGEEASKVWVKVNTGKSNNYVENSSGIDNNLTSTGLDGIDSAKFVYLQDNTPGVFATQADRANGENKDVGVDEIYKGKQFNTFQDRDLKFYVGKDAGKIGSSGEPIGGDLDKGESAYIEFNATVGRTFTYTPIKYTVGYAMDLAGKVIQGPTSIMERCETEEKNVKITLLNGLKVVNQNFKDYGDTASDKNKTLSQDDRLYTQVAELPFDINVIFKPDINDVFKKYCKEENSEGKCSNYHTDSFDICDNYAGIFEKVEIDGEIKCRAQKYKKLPDGTWGIDYGKEGELDGTLQNFPLPGKLYLSAIRNGSGCKYVDNRLKLPFKINGTRYMTDYDTGFMGYQESKKKKIMPIEKVEFEDAFSGVTFMFSYYPRGLSSPDTNTTLFVGDWNSTVAYDYNRTNDTWVEVEFDPKDEKSIEKYYIWLQTQMLYKKYIPGYSMSLSEDDKRKLIREFFKKDKDGNFVNADKIAKFDEELETIKDEINDASAFFGVEMSPDGSFHVCDSDSFVVRPAYFKADLGAADKYAKLIDMNKANPKDDLTKGNTTEHEHNYRVGGDYSENIDVLSKMFYASSNQGNPVPNYYAVIGRDSGYSRFRIRDSYDSHSLSIENNASIVETAYREVKTYLKPFISDQCYNSINNHAFYIEKEPENRTDKVYSTLGTCANTPTPYNGFKFENGGYVLDKTDDITQDRNKTKRDLFGKYMESCKINGQVFGEYYRKIWDKTAVTLTADFGLKDINIQGDGFANLKRFSQNELIAQGLLEPKDKEKVPAALYTALLVGSDNKPKGEIFNYYNVGDVLVSIYDNSWTDAHGDQTFDKRKGPDGYWGSTCVINSTSNKHDEFGKVGCDVGMKDDQYVVLRYLPAKMEIAIAGLDNSKKQIDTDENGTAILADENIRNAFSFTYFNQPDVANSSHGAINQALLAPAQLRNLAYLNISADAYISGKVYPNVIATLYDGKKIDINGTSVARCGFANEFDLKISFNFDCQTNPADARCAAATVVPTTLANDRGAYNYTPFKNKRAENNDTLDRFSINIPATTQFFTEAQCDQNSIGSDSRCFKINSKGLNAEATLGPGFQLPLPVKHALNLYSDISENSGLLNMKDSVSGFYNPKRDPFKLLATAFNQGRTVVHTSAGIAGDSARIYVNFDRMHKSPHRPLVIASTDFNVTEATDNNKTITPASFNTTYNLLDTTNSETHTNSLNPVTLTTNKYMAKVRDEYGIGILGATNSSAYFVYGKANEISDGGTLYSSFINTAITMPINSMLYCGQANNCTDVNVTTLFNGFTDGSRHTNGFVINEDDNYTAANILSEFVSAYNPESSIITSARDGFTQGGVENTSYNSQQVVSGRVRVLTNPWLIYTPADSNTQIFVDSINANGIPQYYNYFKLRFAIQGNWGGHGKRKSDGDVVGNFIVTDDDLNRTSPRKNTKDINLNSGSRMDW
ncbi:MULTISPECIES: hypothetical protein [unclassified Campylobacter]|uniref:hypothetical protein n=1 Tax=unclassified Campylobacter TaxID=2593542 RepID=UPI0022EA07C1|nr:MULTISPECIES: hypothetical protein [unclassified Campylobacter]MDA3055741.1 hypothetical protein [Campylobacter sp. CN_NA1]MDA3064995.1 hypothetical protein [Campylobacter sp. CN_NE4]MDA3068597.1 hypothetical protein [Campylobacter sp. CN_NE3]MDA3082080.1 hypothetical protein [Campylobacter sp. CN_EL2]MDA3084182.1 hypothetical protein [Campylobacter sp. CN_NE1]